MNNKSTLSALFNLINRNYGDNDTRNSFYPDIAEKTALITGSTRGIGIAMAQSLGFQGAKIIIHGRTNETVEAAISKLKSKNIDVIGFSADFSNPDEIEDFTNNIIKKTGQLDIIIHNAAIMHTTPIDKITPEEHGKIMSVNVNAPLLITQKFIHIFKKQKSGRIIFISSISGLNGRDSGSSYSASKSSLVGLARSLAKELGPYGVNSNIVAPGLIETDGLHKVFTAERLKQLAMKTSVRRLGKPQDIASLVSFLVSDDASFINGAVIIADGGLSLV